MSAIPTIWFPLKLLWTHRTHLGNYASCNAGLTCQRTAQGQPGDWPSCDKSALTSSKLIWPGADCWQLIILAIPSSRQVQGRWRRRMSGVRKGEEDVGKGKKWIFNFIPPIFLLVFFCWTRDELWDILYLFISAGGFLCTAVHYLDSDIFRLFSLSALSDFLDMMWGTDSEVRSPTFMFYF